MNISDKIRKLRRDRNLTQDQLASKIGVSLQTIFRWEDGKVKKISIDDLEKIAEALEKPIEYFIKDEEDPEIIRHRLVGYLTNWAQNTNISKLKALIDFLKTNGN